MKIEAKPEARVGSIDELCINTIRTLAMDAVERAASGHPGAPMGAASMAYTLWTRFLRHNPRNPSWFDRDRFVLSAGHASMLLYSLLHLTGYDLDLDDIKAFRSFGSKTPGHPEYGHTPGVETTTGPLGQGFANGVGMAMAECFLADRFNRDDLRLVDHYVYAIVSDGDLMEGVSSEAASLAGHLRLGKLVYLYDSNRISIDGPTDLAFTEDAGARFEAYGWDVSSVQDGNDIEALASAIDSARRDPRPSLIVVNTHIGFGSPNKQDTAAAHGAPLGPDEVRAAKRNLGWPAEQEFHIPQEALDRMRAAVAIGEDAEAEWMQRLEAYRQRYPEDAAEFERIMAGELPPQWDADLPVFSTDDAAIATRKASGKAINALAKRIPELIGGSADLAESNNTNIDDAESFSAVSAGWNIHFGVREHAMGSALNGMVLHGGVRAFGATFLIFSDYMRPAIRLAALMGQPVTFVFTHDSVGLGEDGPTHQPIEQLTSLRAIPNLVVLRPADANETVGAWRVAMTRRDGPVALCLTRQSLPILPLGAPSPVEKGAYVVSDPPGSPDIVLIATGSEVRLALGAGRHLLDEEVAARVVSMPSWELFERQPQAYRDEILPPGVPRLAVEAASAHGWCRWVGDAGAVIGLDRFGASAPGDVVMKELGFTEERVLEEARRLLQRR